MGQVLEQPRQTLRQRLKRPVYSILSEDMMLVLALLLVPAIILPYIFSFSPLMLFFFDVVNYAVIVAFILEYALKLYVADSRKEFVLNPWHVLDLAVILLALAGSLPVAAFIDGRASPVLRLLRVFQALFVTGRMAGRAVPARSGNAVRPPVDGVSIKAYDGKASAAYEPGIPISKIVSSPANVWVDVDNVSIADIGPLAAAMRIPPERLESKLLRESFPRVEHVGDTTTVFIRDVKLSSAGLVYGRTTKAGVLLVCSADRVMSLSREKNDLFERVTAGKLAFDDDPVAIRILFTVLQQKKLDYEELTHHYEDLVQRLEDVPVQSTSPKFLDECFQLKKDINRFHNTLKHFKQALGLLRSPRSGLSGMDDRHFELLQSYQDEAEYLHEIIETVKDDLSSLIELHINTVSFDINRVMRVLALITVLGLIPSILFGLLCARLVGPLPELTAVEVLAVLGVLMGLGMYFFYKAGWLK